MHQTRRIPFRRGGGGIDDRLRLLLLHYYIIYCQFPCPKSTNRPLTVVIRQISEEDKAVGPVAEYMFTQALETTGLTGRPLETTLNDKGPVLSRNRPAPKPTENGSGGGPPFAPPKQPPDNKLVQPSVTKMNGTGPKNSPSPQTLPDLSSDPVPNTQSSKSSRIHYPLVAPSLSDLSDYDEVENDTETELERLSPSLVAQFEAQFEARKLEIRTKKIREFHQLACEADIRLCVNLASGRRGRILSRQEENKMVEEHYQRTVVLRQRMEKERKEQVKQEQRRLRDEFSRRNSSSTSLFGQIQGPHQGRPAVESPDSDAEPEDDMQQRFERMKQEQLALQAKYGVFEQPVAEPQMMRRRAGTFTNETISPAIQTSGILNDKRFDESGQVSTPRPSASAWSTKPAVGPSNRDLGNILGQNMSRKNISLFDSAEQQSAAYDIDGVDHQADNEDDREKENAAFWSHLTSSPKKRTPVPPVASPFNFSTPQKAPLKPLNGKSRLGMVTSAWDDNFDTEETNAVADITIPADKEADKDVESSQEKTPVIPSAPAPNVPQNKKQSKKQRQANKRGAPAAASTATKAAPPVPTPLTQKAQAKMSPVNIPNKPGTARKASLADGDDISSTPRPSMLKKLQAQLVNEEGMNEYDDTPTTPRPAFKRSVVQNNNPWGRTLGKGAGTAPRNSGFDDDVADLMDTGLGATSSRTTLDGTDSKKNGLVADSPQVPGSWKWGTVQSDQPQNQADPPVASGRKGQAGRASAASVNNAVEPESNKRKGKKVVNGQRSAWGKRATVEMEEVPDDEGDGLFSGMQNESLPYNSRTILEQMNVPEAEQPKILEPKPSKPRTMYENIFHYGEAAPDPGVVHDLRGELNDWSDERIVNALARMAQESAEMDRKVNGLPAVPVSNAGVSMNGNGATNVNMNGNGAVKATDVPRQVTENVKIPKQVRWQQQPSTIGHDTTPAYSNNNKMVSRSYDDEAFSPIAASNGFPGFHFGSYGSRTNGAAAGWTASNGQFPLTGNPLIDAEADDDELTRTARSLFENIHISVSSQQRNRPGFAAA
ncbi:hypothetical protein AX15_002691 [Amanita polypyramis BW_CC]|nr:hypothetical protein AX15_002691 [Amanita polypyramis BW_CC]